MAFLTAAELDFAEAIAALTFGNQFLPERVAHERRALGREYVATGPVWHNRLDPRDGDANILKLKTRVAALLERLRARLTAGADPGPHRELYVALVLYHLYYQHDQQFQDVITECLGDTANPRIGFYAKFRETFARDFGPLNGAPAWLDPAHVFALLFQVRRAFYFIFHCLLGGSMPVAKLRAAVWQSIFTHDLQRYVRGLYRHLGDFNTLIMGPSGTGKDLVARAIGLARYMPFEPARECFAENFAQAYHPLSISALSPTLVESELFGHCQGAFTGARQDRTGHLEACSPRGTIFLDEVGEITADIQVKLLRVLQSRTFQRLGDTKPRIFAGKIVAATNRDLAAALAAGTFRHDFYYRLCSDVIVTPSLREQLEHGPEELHDLVALLVQRCVGPEDSVAVTGEVLAWMHHQLGPDYPWPGNVRELEQCVRNIVVRREYHPGAPPSTGAAGLLDTLRAGRLTADELLRYYCTLVYRQTHSFQEVARRLDLDRRTVRAKLDPEIVKRLGG